MTLDKLFVKSAETGLSQQKSDGSMPAGQNGPHNDPETPVRNTSHWSIIYLKAWELSGRQKFLNAAELCLQYLMSSAARPEFKIFYHRTNPEKDASNGVMGQAWTIEAFAYAWKHLKNSTYLEIAEQVFNLHSYNKQIHCWCVLNLDGSFRGFDKTFNHQLWFAAIGTVLLKQGVTSVKEPVLHFLDMLKKNLDLYSDGIIRHYPYGYAKKDSVRQLVGKILSRSKEIFFFNQQLYHHSVSYHGYNTYALSIIADSIPDHEFFKTDKFRKCLQPFSSDSFEEKIQTAKFGYPYNPPGIEAAVSIQHAYFWPEKKRKELITNWLNNQFRISFDPSKYRMDQRTPDPLTLHARLYELYRLHPKYFSLSFALE